MNAGIYTLCGKHFFQQRLISDLSGHKPVMRVFFYILQVARVSGLGALFEINDAAVWELFQGKTDKVGADKATTTGNQYLHHCNPHAVKQKAHPGKDGAQLHSPVKGRILHV